MGIVSPPQQAPTINGPDKYDRNALPIEFYIGPTWNRYIAVEVASDWRLFDRANFEGSRTPQNWFASWINGLIEASGETTYTLPLDAWQNLRAGQYIYYRVLSSADKSAWTNFQSSTSDDDAPKAPRVELTGLLSRDPLPIYRPDTAGWQTGQPS